MNQPEEIVNRVAASPLLTFDLEQYYKNGERILLDITDQLFQGLVLREKDFRDFIRKTDWSAYQDKFVAITCTADAIVPTWAYMLLTTAIQPYAAFIVFGTLEDLEERLLLKELETVDWSVYEHAKVVVKGCSKVNVPVSIYVEATRRLRPLVSSLMFGEPCSTVPLFKRPKV